MELAPENFRWVDMRGGEIDTFGFDDPLEYRLRAWISPHGKTEPKIGHGCILRV